MRVGWECGVAIALLWQAAMAGTQPMEPTSLSYQRAITVTGAAGGTVCAVLDARTLAHTAGGSAENMWLFAQQKAGPQQGGHDRYRSRSVPFQIQESGVDPEEATEVDAHGIRVLRGGTVEFVLTMPARATSEVDLRLGITNFVGTATVSAVEPDASRETGLETWPKTALGTFPIFDLSPQGLGRSTRLSLAENHVAALRVRLQLWTPDQRVLKGITAAAVEGATIPPSREAETLYTPIAVVDLLHSAGNALVAELAVPAHVPLERVAVELEPEFHGDFAGTVMLQAIPVGAASTEASAIESVKGFVSAIQLPKFLRVNPSALQVRQLSFAAPLAANLQKPVLVRVTIRSNTTGEVPVRAVRLEMRQRSICFEEAPAETYTLRYGDSLMSAPVYPLVQADGGWMNKATGDFAGQVDGRSGVMPGRVALLGPEQPNPAFRTTERQRIHHSTTTDAVWVGLFAVLAGLGALLRAASRTQGGQ